MIKLLILILFENVNLEKRKYRTIVKYVLLKNIRRNAKEKHQKLLKNKMYSLKYYAFFTIRNIAQVYEAIARLRKRSTSKFYEA